MTLRGGSRCALALLPMLLSFVAAIVPATGPTEGRAAAASKTAVAVLVDATGETAEAEVAAEKNERPRRGVRRETREQEQELAAMELEDDETLAACADGMEGVKEALRLQEFAIPRDGENVAFVEGGSSREQFEYIGRVVRDELRRQRMALSPEARIRPRIGPTVCETGFNYGTSAYAFLCIAGARRVLSWDLGRHRYVEPAFNLLIAAYPGQVSLVLGDSNETLREAVEGRGPFIHGERCDVVFVDGGHYTEQTLADIENFAKLARTDALILVDDCMHWGGGMAGAAFKEAVRRGYIDQEPELARQFNHERGVCAGRLHGTQAPLRETLLERTASVVKRAWQHGRRLLR